MPTHVETMSELHGAKGSEAREAYETLLGMASGKVGKVPTEPLVSHVMRVTDGGDWPLRRAAMEAVLRRWGFGRRDGLRVAERPKAGAPFGVYVTRRARQSRRPYRTVLHAVHPLRGSCDCPDFLRSSLGVCKHLLTALHDLGARPRKLERAIHAAPRVLRSSYLSWDPVRPLTGMGDPLLRVAVHGPDGASPALEGLESIRSAWVPGPDGTRRLAPKSADDPASRLALVEEMLELLRRRRANARDEPALRALLRQERLILGRAAEAAGLQSRHRRALRSLRQKLYPYQQRGVERFLSRGRLLLADDMGLGKTAQAIAACHALYRSGTVQRGLLIVPASLKFQWEREWRAFSKSPIKVVEGPADARWALYRRRPDGFLVANYEQVLRDLSAMKRFDPGVVVLDEAQRIKNWATKTAVHVKQLDAAYRLVLTGTPLENRLEELASILDWVDDHALEPKWRLVPWHTQADEGGAVVGARNLHTLRERLAPAMVRRRRAEILTQLPPRTDTVVPVTMTDPQKEEHDDLARPIAKLVHAGKRRPLTQAEFLRLMGLLTTQRVIANGLAQLNFVDIWEGISQAPPEEALLQSLSSPKLLELKELIERVVVEQGRKVVVFSQWRRMLSLASWAVSEALGARGLRHAFFTGREDQRRRVQSVVDFHDEPDVRVLFATDAGGVGLNLQRAATCCINLDLPWNPAVLEQRIARIHRLGQERPIDVYNLVASGSIEARIAGIVAAKKALFSGLFDGATDEVRFDEAGSFLAGVERLLEPADDDLDSDGEGGDADQLEEDEVVEAREVERVLAAADESGDRVLVESRARDVGEGRGAAPRRPGSSHSQRAPAFEGGPPSGEELRRLFGELEIEPREDGGVRIEASPEAAAVLGTLFEGMARMLRASE